MLQSQSILVVEDSDDDFDVIIRAFNKAKLAGNLKRSVNGDQALHYLNNNAQDFQKPNLILLDLNMPGIDGREVLREIKTTENLKNIPVIILTTSKDETDIEECYRIGANAYMQKPSDFSGYMKVIEAINNFWFDICLLPSRCLIKFIINRSNPYKGESQ